MRTAQYLFIALAICCVFFSCKEDPATKIPALEAAFAESNSVPAADSLIQIYQAAVQAHPDKAADNLEYLSKAAALTFDLKKNAVGAIRMLDEGLKTYGNGQNLTAPIGVLARIWCAYQYKTTPDLSRNPDDIDQMRAILEQNFPWIDSCLVRIDKEMGGAKVVAQAKAEQYLQISEAYATLLDGKDANKQANILMKAAGLAKAIGDPNKALRLYYNIAEKMPDNPKAPTALFMMAFIQENDLNNLEKAKSTYELFLERYPNDPDYADDAQHALKYLGMSAEDIIKQFEKNPQ